MAVALDLAELLPPPHLPLHAARSDAQVDRLAPGLVRHWLSVSWHCWLQSPVGVAELEALELAVEEPPHLPLHAARSEAQVDRLAPGLPRHSVSALWHFWLQSPVGEAELAALED